MIDEGTTESLSQSDRVMMLTPVRVEGLARRFGLEPTTEAIIAKLGQEKEMVETFYKNHPEFTTDVDSIFSMIENERFATPRQTWAKSILCGPLTAHISLLDSGKTRSGEPVDSPKAGLITENYSPNRLYGFYDNFTDVTYTLLPEDVAVQDYLRILMIYVHENMHGAGIYSETGGSFDGPNRGIRNNNLEEGICQTLAERYVGAHLDEDELNANRFNEITASGPYLLNIKLFKTLGKNLSENLIFESQFKGKTAQNKAQVEDMYGEGAYDLFFGNSWESLENLIELAENWRECGIYLAVTRGTTLHGGAEGANWEFVERWLRPHFRRNIERQYIQIIDQVYSDPSVQDQQVETVARLSKHFSPDLAKHINQSNGKVYVDNYLVKEYIQSQMRAIKSSLNV